MTQPILSLKQFGAWGTGLMDKYRFNPFFQATVHIVAIQFVLAIILIGVTGWAIQYAQTNTVGTIRYHILESQLAAQTGTAAVGKTLPDAIATVRTHTLAYVFIGMTLLIGICAYFLIRFALEPTKKSMQFQKRFIGNIAHEIRTPLAIIKTSTEVSLMDPTLSADHRETLLGTIVELDRISETINNLLSFDMLIRPERLNSKPINLQAISQDVIKRHLPLAASRGIELTLDHQGTQRILLGNPVAIEEVLTNLIKNALNYTPANINGKVTVRIEPEFRNRIALSVTDTGIGIASKDLMHIFEPFYRGDTSRTRGVGTGSSGLGLAIVNEIARMHRGTTTVRSTLGKGTSIKISFPAVLKNDSTKLPALMNDEEVQEVSIDFS